MESQIILAFLLTLFAGLSTGFGSLLSYFIKKTNFSYLSFLLSFSAGVMIFISFIKLLTTAIEGVGFLQGNLGFFAGIVVIYLIDKFLPHKHVDTKPDAFHKSKVQQERLKEVGVLTAVGIAIHNFPEGLAVFTVSLESISLGLSIAIAIAIHNIPEGIAVAIPIYYATGDRKKAFFYSFFSGVAEPIGAVIGFFFLAPFINSTVLNLTLAIVGGIMVFISFDELLPISREYGDEHTSILGLFTGMFLMMISLHIL